MSKGSIIVLESSIVCFRTRGGKFLVDPVAKSIIRIVVAEELHRAVLREH